MDRFETRFVGALAAAALLTGCAGGAAPEAESGAAAEAAPMAKTVAQQIDAVEMAWADALRRKDRAELERLLAPEFELVGPTVTDRAQWFANLETMRIERYAVRVTDVRTTGEAAMATVQGEWTVSRGGPAMQDAFTVEDTWVRRGDAWQVTRRRRLGPGPRPE